LTDGRIGFTLAEKERQARAKTATKPPVGLGGNVMWRIAALCWVFTAPALAGALVVAVLATPPLAAEAELWIPIAALLGALYGVPAARSIARFLEAPAAPEAVALRWGWGISAPTRPPARRSGARHLRLVVF